MDRIASSLDLCPKVIGVDHLVIESCVLQVMLLLMMMLLIERSSVAADDDVSDRISSVVVDDRVIECCRRSRSKVNT